MGAGQSTPSEDHLPARAFHVLRVTPSSPASQTNIEPFFDFVIGFEGDSLASDKPIDASELERIVESHEERTLNLLIWNSKSKTTRVVAIIPSRTWSLLYSDTPTPQKPEAELQPSLLGLSMRLCEPEFALDNVWHVLDVLEGSPAESAGLVPYGDWIIGWSGGVLTAEGDFYDVVEAHIDKPLRVYVYSFDFDTLREVVLVPNRQWGGEGLLGCVFGFGLLHRIPSHRDPGEVSAELQEHSEDYDHQQLFVPADVDYHTHETIHESSERQWRAGDWKGVSHANNTPRSSLGAEHSSHIPDTAPGPHDSPNHELHAYGNVSEPASDTEEIVPRTTSWASRSMSTPTRDRSMGSLMNGYGSPETDHSVRTSVTLKYRTSSIDGLEDDEEPENDDDDDDDAGTSVTSTETTGVGSEVASLGSLTSVD